VKSRTPENLGSVLERVVSSSRLKDVFRNRAIYEAWAETADDFADQTRVVGLQRGKLVVACQSQALASELSAFRKGELLAALNEKMGGGGIEDIRFVVEGEDAGR
jgi:predicted nucleic acid-binding Zn ribbon protein